MGAHVREGQDREKFPEMRLALRSQNNRGPLHFSTEIKGTLTKYDLSGNENNIFSLGV